MGFWRGSAAVLLGKRGQINGILSALWISAELLRTTRPRPAGTAPAESDAAAYDAGANADAAHANADTAG